MLPPTSVGVVESLMAGPTTLFPTLSPSYILTFQFSSWYPTFASHSIKSTIIRPLSDNFRDYLNADGVFVPEGSENALVCKNAIPCQDLSYTID
jgi:D123